MPIATDEYCSLSVYPSVGNVCEPCKNGLSDPDAISGLTHMVPRNHVLYGGQDPPRGRGNFGGCLAH